MLMYLKKWREDEGSVDYIQVVVGVLIVAIAAVGLLQTLFWGYEQFDYDIRYKKAVSVARSYAEYWQGRIHVAFPKTTDPNFRRIIAGNQNNPDVVLLDQRDPNDVDDDVYCRVSYRLQDRDLETTGTGIDYWEIHVRVQWDEPNEGGLNVPKREITFFTAMNPGT